MRNDKDREGFLKQVNECLRTLATEGEERLNIQNKPDDNMQLEDLILNTAVAKEGRSNSESLPSENTTHVTDVSEQPSKKAKSPFAWFQIQNIGVNKAKSETKSVVLKPLKQRTNDEIKRYNAKCTYFTLDSEENNVFNPLSWWKENATEFPILSGIARRLFVITASSAECERHFSAFNARNIITAQRNGMYPETVQAISILLEAYKNKIV